jgi:hypothetical protein
MAAADQLRRKMTNPIDISIPVELTAVMVISRGVIGRRSASAELARELHGVVARCIGLFRAEVKVRGSVK